MVEFGWLAQQLKSVILRFVLINFAFTMIILDLLHVD